MLAEVKLLMEDKISGDREKGEETPTTKTKCVPLRGSCQAAKLRGAACCGVALSGAAVCAAPLSRVGRPCFCGSVFQKTYGYVTRFSYPNATVETAQSIRECATLMPHARAL